MKEKRRNSYKPFWIAFLSSLLVLGSVFTLFFYLTVGRVTESSLTDVEVPQYTYTPAATENRNLLIIGCPERSENAVFFLLVRFDAVNSEFKITAVPPEAEATVNVKTLSISEHYSYGSSNYAVQAVENLFLIRINNYIRVDSSSIQQLVDFYGGLEFDLPYEIPDSEYNLTEGLQLMDGVRCAEAMMTGDLALNGDMLQAFVESKLTAAGWEKKDDFFNLIFNQTDTDLTSLQLQTLSPALKLFFEKKENKTEIFPLEGEYYDDGTAFMPDQDSIALIRDEYS